LLNRKQQRARVSSIGMQRVGRRSLQLLDSRARQSAYGQSERGIALTTGNNTLDAVVAVAVAAWAIVNTVFGAVKIINERRDAVILGHLDGQDLNERHRWLIVHSDYLPMMAGLILLCLAGLAALCASFHDVNFVKYPAGLLFLFVLVGGIASGFAEYFYMRSRILEDRATKKSAADQPKA
jgi:hypothetical protein